MEREPKADLVSRARDFAFKAHEGQTRKSREPYIIHPAAVVEILSKWGIKDEAIIAAGWLHDVVEDSKISLDDIKREFGGEVADLVDAVSKLRSDSDRETIKKVSGRTLDDPRVAVLKLADRLHNMRTLSFLPKDKQIPKAQETLDIYTKLAESLGMWEVKRELEDWAFMYVDRPEYDRLAKLVKADPRNGDLFRAYEVSKLELIVGESGVKADVHVRNNSLWAVRQKMDKQLLNQREVNDMVSFRITAENSDDCYKLLGKLRGIFAETEIQSKFSDYLAHPTENGYSAIQMTVDTPHGAIEIAITTREKEEFNNWGVVSLIRKGEKELSKYALKLIYTPSGHVRFMPPEATGVDFAYAIDPGLGARATGLLVDGVEEPLSFIPANGSEVEVVAGPAKIAPNPELAYYCLESTKRVIEEQLANQVKEGQIVRGQSKVEDILRANCGLINMIDFYSFEKYGEQLSHLLYNLGAKGSLRNLYYLVETGSVTESMLTSELESRGLTKDQTHLSTILLEGVDRPRVMEKTGKILGKTGVNIGALDLSRREVSGKLIFSFRLVVENLNKGLEATLTQELKDKCQIEKVLIV
jgi:GTP pyrophosphokinase